MIEQVLVVDRAAVFDGRWPHGFLPVEAADRPLWLERLAKAAYFVARDVAERDPERKQLVPYCVLRHGDAVLCVERLKAQGETRLHGLWSIGLGGHVNPEDGAISADIFPDSLHRELHEELVLPAGLPAPEFVGLLNDDTNPVGRVHVGLVHELVLPRDVPQGSVKIREISKLRGAFRVLAGPSRVWQDPPRFETWSDLLLERFSPRTETSPLSPTEDSLTRHGREESGHGGTSCGQAVS